MNDLSGNDLSGACQPCCALLYELPLTTLLLGDSFHPGGGALTRQLAEQALVGPGSLVLDVACGKGHSARLLADEFGARVSGVDYSGLLLQAARQATTTELLQRVTWQQADVHRLPFAARQFDVVFCECALCTFADASRALAEMLRVLKPGGRLALSDVVLNAPLLPAQLQSALGHALCLAGARSTAAYQALLTDAGFSAIRNHDVSRVLLDMVQQIARRLQLAEVIATLQQTGLPRELGNPAATLDVARTNILQGALGYQLFLARKPLA